MNRFFRLYLSLTDGLVRSQFFKKRVAAARVEAFLNSSWLQRTLPSAKVRSTWFHAASVGELEMLRPLIQSFVNRQIPVGVSIFSESALSSLQKLPEELIYAGFSPKESEWKVFFEHFQVERVVVSKYEAWPGMWAAISALDVPLVVINAQPRTSLSWVRRALKCFGVRLPRLSFFAVDEFAARELQDEFPSAQIEAFDDPRWVRVIERSKNALHHPRVEHYRAQSKDRPRPYGIVGSAWIEDLEVLVPAVTRGTLWVVPHSLAQENLVQMRNYLNQHLPGRFILVDEMGVLAELYSLADWVWVGGGFGKGIHSTLEPAVFHVPIACGPKRVNDFFETHDLRRSGHLTVCSNTIQAARWLKDFQTLKPLDLDKKMASFDRLVEHCLRVR